MPDNAWWENPLEVQRVEVMLVRARVLPDDERAYYRGKPHKWQKEASYASRMEQLMLEAGVDPKDGWSMTGAELMAQLMAPRPHQH